MPTNKDIAEWLREAAEDANSMDGGRSIEYYLNRATQVEQMRCEMCNKYTLAWNKDYGRKIWLCDNPNGPIIQNQPKNFGCWQWEVKEVE